ncbi:MAG: DciA family protein [Candidatus Omnitrophota bacterium]
MEAIKNTVMNVMESLAAKKARGCEDDPQGWLKSVLTKGAREHIKINYFKKGVLSINVDSSSWLYSLTLQKEDILANLSKFSSDIKDIRFRIGEI